MTFSIYFLCRKESSRSLGTLLHRLPWCSIVRCTKPQRLVWWLWPTGLQRCIFICFFPFFQWASECPNHKSQELKQHRYCRERRQVQQDQWSNHRAHCWWQQHPFWRICHPRPANSKSQSGGFQSHRATPSNHPNFLDGIFMDFPLYKPSSYGGTPMCGPR